MDWMVTGAVPPMGTAPTFICFVMMFSPNHTDPKYKCGVHCRGFFVPGKAEDDGGLTPA